MDFFGSTARAKHYFAKEHIFMKKRSDEENYHICFYGEPTVLNVFKSDLDGIMTDEWLYLNLMRVCEGINEEKTLKWHSEHEERREKRFYEQAARNQKHTLDVSAKS